jgi:hypothetical protein
MIDKRPDPGDEYRDWEYPDPKDIEEMSNLPFNEGTSSSKGLVIPVFLKLFGAIMLLAFVGSLLLPVLEPLTGGGNRTGTSSGTTTQEIQAYQQWIGSSVSSALNDSGTTGQVQFLGVQFGDSIQDPTIGILAEGLDPQSSPGKSALQNYSIAVLQRLFSDERAESVTLAWLGPATDSEGGQSFGQVILMIGMLKETAQSINWAYLRADDLRNIADYYHESPPTTQESLSIIWLLDNL